MASAKVVSGSLKLASEEERKVLAAGKQAASLACLCRSQLAAQLTCCGVRGPGRLLTRKAAKKENVVFDGEIIKKYISVFQS